MLTTSRVLSIATLIASVPILLVTLVSWRSAQSQGAEGAAKAGGVTLGKEVDIESLKKKLEGGPEAIRARGDQVGAWPITEFFSPGFSAPALNAPAGDDIAATNLGKSLTELSRANQAFVIIERYIPRGGINALLKGNKEDLNKLTAELSVLANDVPTLKTWSQRLDEMANDFEAFQSISGKLDAVERELHGRVSDENTALIYVPDSDLKKWNQALSAITNPQTGPAVIDRFPSLMDQHQKLKRRVGFWTSWNPPMPFGKTTKPTATELESRRANLTQLESKAKVAADGAAELPEEIRHIENIAKEIDHLAGEVLYQQLQESLASKKNAPKSIGELLLKMQPIIETGTHREDLLKDFKTAVERGLAAKKARSTKLPLYDFVVQPEGHIWLAHSDRKPLAGGGIFISSYDIEADQTVELDRERQFLNPTNDPKAKRGFLKVSDPTELRIVKEFNESSEELLKSLDQIDSWKALQTRVKEQEQELSAYYRQMKQFWDRPETGRHRLAADMDFAADQQFIKEVLEHWSIVESLYRR